MAVETETIFMLVDDMFFAAKIRGAAQAAGRQVTRVKSGEQLEQLSLADSPALFIIDLNSDSLDPIKAIELLKAGPGAVTVVGFLSHIQTDLKRAAELAGCDYVVPRSVFTQRLSDIVAGDLSSLEAKRTQPS